MAKEMNNRPRKCSEYNTLTKSLKVTLGVVQLKLEFRGFSFLAICVIDREGLRNLAPPCEGYYAKSR